MHQDRRDKPGQGGHYQVHVQQAEGPQRRTQEQGQANRNQHGQEHRRSDGHRSCDIGVACCRRGNLLPPAGQDCGDGGNEHRNCEPEGAAVPYPGGSATRRQRRGEDRQRRQVAVWVAQEIPGEGDRHQRQKHSHGRRGESRGTHILLAELATAERRMLRLALSTVSGAPGCPAGSVPCRLRNDISYRRSPARDA